MTLALSSRVKKIEKDPAVVKAIEDRRKLQCWEAMLRDYMPYLKRHIEMLAYDGCKDRPEVIADDYMEFEITATLTLLERYPIEVGQCWPIELVLPVRREVHRELLLRWYGVRRTPEEETEVDRICEQMIKDLDAGVPSEQSEAAAYFRRWYEQHPRRSYKYYELDQFKPDDWTWEL